MTNGRVEVITSLSATTLELGGETATGVGVAEPGASVSAVARDRGFNRASCMVGGGSWVSGRGSALRRCGSRRKLRPTA